MALPDTVQRRRDSFDVDALLTDTEKQTITADGNSTTPLEVGVGMECEVVVDVDTIAGTTPTIDISIEGAIDAAFTVPVAIMSFPQIDDSIDPLQDRLAFKSEHEFVRAAWVTLGTAETFDVTISLRS